MNPLLGILSLFLLTACASFPGTTADLIRDQRKPVVVQLPAYVSPHVTLKASAVTRFVDALGRKVGASGVLTWRVKGLFEGAFDKARAIADYRLTAVLDPAQAVAIGKALKVTHVGLLDILPGDGGKVQVYYRLVEIASASVVSFRSALLEPGKEGDWVAGWVPESKPAKNSDTEFLLPDNAPWTRWWASAPAGDALTDRWIAMVAPARARADFGEMRRLIDLVVDRLGTGASGPATTANEDVAAAALWSRNLVALRREVASQEQAVAVEHQARELLAELAQPSEPGYALAASKYRVLDRARSGAAALEAANRPTVRNAFLARFGVALPVALAQTMVVPVPEGTFLMGAADGNPDEAPVHRVSVGSFWLGRTEVTQGDYLAVMKSNPSLFNQGPQALQRPVERVTWYDAVEYCNALSVQEGLQPAYQISQRTPAKGSPVTSATVVWDRSKDGYRLPTEAEWEWAARGANPGQVELLSGGGDPSVVAWTDGKGSSTAAVALKAPNALGLYDMSGNVWEWCQDWYGKYSASPATDPIGPEAGVLKVGRGGSWRAAAWNARITGRSYDAAGSRGNVLGFRVARNITPFPTR